MSSRRKLLNSVVSCQYYDILWWKLPSYLLIADPYFHIPDEIEILLGLEIFWKILKIYYHSLGLPTLQETEFRWMIADSVRTTENDEWQMVFFVHSSNNELLNGD